MNDSFKYEIADIKSKMCSIDAQLKHTLAIKETVEAVEKAVDYTSSRLDDIYKASLPALTKHVEQVAVGLAMQTLDLDVHRRKWTLTIQGLKGPADEDEDETRAACVALARDYLQVDNASDTDLAACHRLSKRTDSGVIVRFKDLKQRSLWLSGAKHLKNHSDKISVSQDLTPVLRRFLEDRAAWKKKKSATSTEIQIKLTLSEILALYWIENGHRQYYTAVGHQRIYCYCYGWVQSSVVSARTKHIDNLDFCTVCYL